MDMPDPCPVDQVHEMLGVEEIEKTDRAVTVSHSMFLFANNSKLSPPPVDQALMNCTNSLVLS